MQLAKPDPIRTFVRRRQRSCKKSTFSSFLVGVALSVLISAFVEDAHAQDNWDFAAPHKARCSVGTMQDMKDCLANELRVVEKRLNVEYQTLLQSLENPEPLKQAQAAWLRFRKLDCDYSASGIGKGGSLYGYTVMACMIDLNEKRIRDLRSYASSDGAGAPIRKQPTTPSR